MADLNFGCATFCALPSFDAVTTFSSYTTFSSHKVNVKCSDIDMCSAINFLFDHNNDILYNLFMSTHCSCYCLIITSLVTKSPVAVKSESRTLAKKGQQWQINLVKGSS